jgi:hypothetical protein
VVSLVAVVSEPLRRFTEAPDLAPWQSHGEPLPGDEVTRAEIEMLWARMTAEQRQEARRLLEVDRAVVAEQAAREERERAWRARMEGPETKRWTIGGAE